MIAYLQGKLVRKTPTDLIVDVNGVGYLVHIPLSTYDRAGSPGDVIQVLTYLYVREEAMELFGFMTEEERELFRALIAVSGVGPRLAQSILSSFSVADFKRALLREDVKMLTSIPGVGKKTAQRLILELKERFGKAEYYEELGAVAQRGEVTPQEEALLALVALGYDYPSAKRMIEKAGKDSAEEMPVGELVKVALKQG